MNQQQAEKFYNKGYIDGYADLFFGSINYKNETLYIFNHVYSMAYNIGSNIEFKLRQRTQVHDL